MDRAEFLIKAKSDKSLWKGRYHALNVFREQIRFMKELRPKARIVLHHLIINDQNYENWWPVIPMFATDHSKLHCDLGGNYVGYWKGKHQSEDHKKKRIAATSKKMKGRKQPEEQCRKHSIASANMWKNCSPDVRKTWLKNLSYVPPKVERIKVPCIICRKEFEILPSRLKWKQQVCSKKCGQQNRRNKERKIK